jgi:hypothetical protein
MKTPVIASASEAIQSRKESLDCFVALLLAMTVHAAGGVCEGSGGSGGGRRRGARQTPALRPAIIQ